MSNKKLKFSRKAVRYALTNASNRSFYGALVAILAIAAGAQFYGQTIFAALLAVLALGGLAALVGSSLVEYATAEAHNKFAMLSGWVKTATTEEERARRLAMLQSDDMDSVMSHANLEYVGPRFNVDGTVMLPGNVGLDINGNIFGATELTSAVFNPDTQAWTDPTNAYESPMGMASVGFDSTMDSSDSFKT